MQVINSSIYIMKKISILSIFVLLTAWASAQNQEDALRYSQSFLQGTARTSSMGNAFGALGGNFTAISINPAGIGVYRTSEFMVTGGFDHNISESSFVDHKYEDFEYDFNFNNIGIVGTFKTGAKSGWISTNIGFGYNRINSFEMNTLVKNPNASGSIVDSWANEANAYGSEALPFLSGMAYSAGLLIHDTINNMYVSDFTGTDYGHNQSLSITTSGYVGEYTFSGGANYDNLLYLGGSFSVNTLRYKEKRIFKESDPDNLIGVFNALNYTETLETRGTGFNFKVGAIVKPIQWLRLGGAIHFPTFYDLDDEYSDVIDADLDLDGESFDNQRSSGEFDYELVTPFKAIASAAFVIQKMAILSLDYEFVDYTKARLRDGGKGSYYYDFEYENQNIQDIYTATQNVRAGLEMRFGALSLRGGYAFFGSPYSSGQLNEDANYSTISGGFGINSNQYYIDFALSHITNTSKYVLYHYGDDSPSADLDIAKNQASVTVGFRF